MKKYNILLALGLAVATPVFTACDDFLDKEPSKSTNKTITDVSQLDALLATYTALYSETSQSFLATDDYGLTPEIQNVRTSNPSIDDLDNFAFLGTNNRTSRVLWDSEFSKIFRANLVLNNIGSVSGSEAEKANVEAEAHFLRAWSMFRLAVDYCLYPSSDNTSELGLPLKATTSFEESVARAPLGETFTFIENDINAALAITKPLAQADGTLENWRGTTASVKAFAARFYLYMGQYDKAAQYADDVLKEYSTLKDFNDPAEMYHHQVNDTYTINAGTPQEEVITVKYPYTKNQFYGTNGYPDFLGWKEMLYSRALSYASWWFIPSEDLMNTFAQDIKGGNPDNDLRFAFFLIKDFGLRYCQKITAGRTPGYCQFYYDNLISGPTVAEMILIKAEKEARAKQTAQAMTQVNTLRKARIATAAYEPLTASSPEEALKIVLRERRREMPFTIRWYDLKRYAWNDDPADDVTVVHKFYPHTSASVLAGDPVETYTLEPKSRHYALPIPQIDILRSDGQLQQNTY